MNEDIAQDVNLVMQKVYSDPKGAKESEPEVEEEIIHVYHFPDALVIIKEPGDSATNIPVVESTLKDADKNQRSMFIAYFAVTTFIFLTLSSILFQFYLLINPPTTTIILLLKPQQISLNGTIHLGRVLPPFTLSQSQTTPTSGHAHQDAKVAIGTVTFYNGSNVAQTINAETILTGQDGVQVATDQAVTVPAANLPQIGEATVSAHAVTVGSQGNIQAFDITTALSNDLTVKNLASFRGGADERDFRTVAKNDISQTAAPLKATLAQSINGALQGQLKKNEMLVTPSCTTAITSDHQPGD